ncbi:uncharacterized protein BJ212DRAFT_1300956 [Suillus subaureus]|uniref:Uncharacterized protein n=1 Tax=Suillus subaureus TaxID=48587 RepID=A0A9P7JC00_9AGAM|nr:uncharacterized protein BJ212DRAFT_1300956 [Suillus subaureus]KAG1813560.1 hypothetical protein BJ212DRAFT_1300956 [Suillus subaureus]
MFLMHETPPNLSPKQVLIDVYITLRELQEMQQQIGEDIAVLVQAFTQEFAVPHLQCFAACCAIERVKPSRHSHISATGPRYIPPPMVATGAQIQCSAQAPNAFSTSIRDINPEVAKSKHWPSVLTTILKILGILVFFKEAHAALRLEQCTKSLQFKDVLEDTWKQLDDVSKTIATPHHKSCGLLHSKHSKANLWNAFCWGKNQDEENDGHGKAVLQSLVHEHKSEYLALSKEEQDELLTEFTAWKEMKKTGFCTTTKSKINNITQTLKAVENELKSLHCHTGVDNFMDTVMWINNQDLVNKMEGFAIQGMKGSAKKPPEAEECTGDPGTKMQWVHYFCNVIQWYQVVVEVLPDKIPFTNLSQVSSALPDLNMFCDRWDKGTMCWRSLSNTEFEKLCLEHEEKLKSGEIMIIAAALDLTEGQSAACKSIKTIRDSDSSNTEPAEPHDRAAPSAGPTPPPIPQPHNSPMQQPSDGPPSASQSFSSDFITPPFDYDAMLADLDQVFGLTPALNSMSE